MFYFNGLKKLILRLRLDLVLSKNLYLKFINKKIIQRRDFNKILFKKLVIFIQILVAKLLIRF